MGGRLREQLQIPPIQYASVRSPVVHKRNSLHIYSDFRSWFTNKKNEFILRAK